MPDWQGMVMIGLAYPFDRDKMSAINARKSFVHRRTKGFPEYDSWKMHGWFPSIPQHRAEVAYSGIARPPSSPSGVFYQKTGRQGGLFVSMALFRKRLGKISITEPRVADSTRFPLA